MKFGNRKKTSMMYLYNVGKRKIKDQREKRLGRKNDTHTTTTNNM